MAERIFIVVVTAVVIALVSYFVNNYGKKNILHGIARSKVEQHEAVKHQDDVRTYTKTAIDYHKLNCAGARKIEKIEKIVIAIYQKQGGDVADIL